VGSPPVAIAEEMLRPALYFRDRNLAHVSGIDHVLLERSGRKATFTKSDGSWKLTQPVEAEAEQLDMDEFVAALSRLRADELVSDKPTELKAYGLDRPAARWKLQVGTKDVLDVVVGGPEKSGSAKGKDTERRYAKLAQGNLVFLLSPALTTKALAEYRSRTLWAPLDASQIDRLSYGYREHPFVLEKVDNDWRPVGQPATKVRADAIRETLDALARLKATRYVVDKGADFKLFGLEPPQCVLEIQTPAGKRAIHLGRPEGESKRVYARIPDGDKSEAVFVISEADAERIARLLRAFVDNGTKVSAAR